MNKNSACAFYLATGDYSLPSIRSSAAYNDCKVRIGIDSPQGENVPDVRNRNRNWMTSLTRDFGGKRVLAITHHMNILAFRANMERLSSHQFIEMEREHAPANCSITVYRGDPSQGVNGRLLLESYDQRLSDQS